jgi:acyl-CoA synthetase (AMP-forming)/AMP-acid ligase II
MGMVSQWLGFAENFAAPADAIALFADGAEISYGELDRRIGERTTELGTGRRLVLIQSSNEVEPLITYLAAVRARHAVMLVPADKPTDDVVAEYRPDTIFAETLAGWTIDHQSQEPQHDLHPDLALLLSTSGSTGTSKFVRLSYDNLAANAASIAEYLQIQPGDRAATSLPLHYCYGLSIVHSHLLIGAGLILTDDSVIEPHFWQLFRELGGTTFPAVPFTFDLLDRIDFAAMEIPTLRYITQAGGRLAPEKVKRYAELGLTKGFDLFVMYGATEATARMAYLPPKLATDYPHTIGQAIPGGSFDLAEDGELLYSGPNVMMGYAERSADLGLGSTIDTLHTGDLARRTGSGLYEIVGRKSRFLKMFGLRISLDAVESFAGNDQHATFVTGTDDTLVLATESRIGLDPERLRSEAAQQFGLPLSSIITEVYDDIPRLESGKVDYPSIRNAALHRERDSETPKRGQSVAAIFARTLGHDTVAPTDTFVSLNGDSLSYIEASLALEEHLGRVPDDWHTTPVGELDAVEQSTSRFGQVETNVVLRAVAIILVVGDHFELFNLQGGAHVLLAVAGYNFSRFLLNAISDSDSVAPIGPSIARIIVPTVGWILLTFALKASFDWRVAFLISSYWTDPDGGYWFIEVLIQILLIAAAVLAIPAARRLHRRSPYAFAVGVLLFSLAARYGGQLIWDTTDIGFKVPHMTLWLFAIGWVADKSSELWQRVALSAVALATVPGYFDSTTRTLVILGGILALIWVSKVSLPKPTNRLVGLLGAASLYIYLVHFQVNTVLNVDRAASQFVIAIVFGVFTYIVAERLLREGERRLRSRFGSAVVKQTADSG